MGFTDFPAPPEGRADSFFRNQALSQRSSFAKFAGFANKLSIPVEIAFDTVVLQLDLDVKKGNGASWPDNGH